MTSIAYLWFGNILGMNLRPVLLMLERLKEWVMLDIYLVGIGVASIKVQDYAFATRCGAVCFYCAGDPQYFDAVAPQRRAALGPILPAKTSPSP